MYDDNQREVDEKYNGYGRTWLKSIYRSLFTQQLPVYQRLDMFLPPRFPCRKDAEKPLLFGDWRREGFSPGGTTSPQLEEPRLKPLYCAPITTNSNFSEKFIVYFIPLFDKCD